ncbi:hypothetical protein [Brevibacillus borstelensis]|uniref:hypothetical protein n=1 Tax=Brevibacillus borstelensis TaxID=45462 RepID=UPI002E1BE163|nr:hypothetical protein [Brevibacillus borstelensis]
MREGLAQSAPFFCLPLLFPVIYGTVLRSQLADTHKSLPIQRGILSSFFLPVKTAGGCDFDSTYYYRYNSINTIHFVSTRKEYSIHEEKVSKVYIFWIWILYCCFFLEFIFTGEVCPKMNSENGRKL